MKRMLLTALLGALGAFALPAAAQDRKEVDLALKDYTKAIQLNPKFTRAYNNRAFVYHDRKDYDRALADYNRAIETDPEYAIAYLNRADIFHTLKRYDNAVKDATAAAKVSAELGVALVAVVIGPGRAVTDLYYDWAKVREVDESGALLVRPDKHIAWRSMTMPANPVFGCGTAVGVTMWTTRFTIIPVLRCFANFPSPTASSHSRERISRFRAQPALRGFRVAWGYNRQFCSPDP